MNDDWLIYLVSQSYFLLRDVCQSCKELLVYLLIPMLSSNYEQNANLPINIVLPVTMSLSTLLIHSIVSRFSILVFRQQNNQQNGSGLLRSLMARSILY